MARETHCVVCVWREGRRECEERVVERKERGRRERPHALLVAARRVRKGRAPTTVSCCGTFERIASPRDPPVTSPGAVDQRLPGGRRGAGPLRLRGNDCVARCHWCILVWDTR